MKKVIIFILICCLSFLIILLNSFNVPKNVIADDLYIAEQFLNLYNNNEYETLNDKVKNVFSQEKEKIQNNDILIPIKFVVNDCSVYLPYGLEEEEKSIDISGSYVNLKDLQNKNVIYFGGKEIIILDLFDNLCYSENRKTVLNNYIYEKYEVKGNTVYIYLTNKTVKYTKCIMITHTVFNKIKDVQVE